MSLLEITIFTTHRVILLVNGNGAKTIASSIHTPDIFYSPEAERNARPDFPALIKTDRSFPIPLFLHFHPTSLQGSNWPAVCSENVCGKTEPARRKPIVRQTERYHRIPRWAVRPSRMAGNISWYPSNTDELVYYEQTTMFPVKMASRGFIIPASPRLTTFHSTVYAVFDYSNKFDWMPWIRDVRLDRALEMQCLDDWLGYRWYCENCYSLEFDRIEEEFNFSLKKKKKTVWFICQVLKYFSERCCNYLQEWVRVLRMEVNIR